MENKPPIIETKNYRKKKDPKKPIKIALAGVAAAAVLGVGIWAVIPKHSNGYDVTSSLTDEVHNHDFINVLSLEEPTCERSGRKVLSCACGEQSVLELMPKGHEEVFAPGVEATCTKEGISDSAFCSACGMVLKPATPIPMISHEEEMIEGKAPTCTEEGVCDGKKCTVCGEITEPMVPIPALGHTEAVWEGKAATCTETGWTNGKICDVCGEILAEREETPKTEHTEVGNPGYAATKYENGLTDGIYCLVCQEEIVLREVIYAYGSQGLAYEVNDDGTCTVTGIGTCTDTELVIPAYIDGRKVTAVGEDAFYNNTEITSVDVREGISEIGYGSFRLCSNLKTVTLCEGVTNIDEIAFFKCTSLEGMVLPDGVTNIGRDAFSNCENMVSVTIPKSVNTVGDSAFNNCKDLRNLYITDVDAWCGIDFVGRYSNPMYYATRLYINGEETTEITISESVKNIDDYAFMACNSLTAVHITSMEAWCNIEFEGAYSNPLQYAKNLYLGGELVTEVIIPENITNIGNYTFEGGSGITNIVLHERVESIGSAAFSGCSGLTSIVIPTGVKSVASGAFSGCSGLNGVYITDMAAWCGIDFETTGSNPLEYAKKLYMNSELVTELEIPAGVTEIKANAFACCESIVTVALPSGITAIGDNAFYRCTSLFEISLPDGVTKIGSNAFYYCQNLYAVEIPDSVTVIGESAFESCSSLTEVDLPSGLKNIGGNMFITSGINKVTIPKSVTLIYGYAFGYCEYLREIIYEGTVAEWEDIMKASNWIMYTHDYTIYCTDGNIAEDGTVTYI